MLTQEELDKLLEQGPDTEGAPQAGSQPPEGQGKQLTQDTKRGGPESAAGLDADWSDAFREASKGGDAAAAKAITEGRARRQPRPGHQASQQMASAPNFDDLEREEPGKAGGNNRPDLDFILDLPLDISVELGRSRMPIRELLQLGQGAVVELNKMAGEPAEIYVNQKLMAKGEVVIVNEKFGVRLVEIISPIDRVKSLA